jgi:hypothetical protein
MYLNGGSSPLLSATGLTNTNYAPQTVVLDNEAGDNGYMYYDDVAVSTNNTAAHYSLVNDQSDNTALQANSTTEQETELLATTSQTGTINSVVVNMVALASTSGCSAETLCYTHSTPYDGASTSIASGTLLSSGGASNTNGFSTYSTTYTTNPNTGLPWTWAEVNALQIGAQATTLPSGDTIQFSQFYVVVNYASQFQVTFASSGLGADATGNLVSYSVNGGAASSIGVSGGSILVDSGAIVTYSFNTVASSNTGEQYQLVSVTGPASGFTVSGPTTLTGNYVTQYEVTFSSSGLAADASGNLVTFSVSGGSYSGATSPISVSGGYIWVNNGASVTYSFVNPVMSTNTGEQYRFGSVTGLTSPISVSGACTVTGNYVTQYKVTFVVSPSGGGSTSPSGSNVWENAGSLSISASANSGYSFLSWSSNTGSITITSTSSASTTATINGVGTITANFLGNLDHFVFSSVGSQIAGTPFTITITAEDASGNTVTSYSGTPTLTYSAGSISPSSATGGFINGVWTGSVTVTAAGSSVTLGVNDGNGQTGTSNPFTVTHASAVSSLTASLSPTSVATPGTVTGSATAYDAYGNTWDVSTLATWSIPAGGDGGSWSSNVYTSHTAGTYTVQATYLGKTATASLTVTARALNLTISASAGANGTISPSGSVSVNYGGNQSFAVTASAGYHIVDVVVDGVSQGAVSSYTFTNVQADQTITASFGINTNTTKTIVGIVYSISNTTTIIPITKEGNISFQQFLTNVTFVPYPHTTSTLVSFTITGPSGTVGFSNMTLPKTAIPYGTIPLVYINGTLAANQGYTQDATNFYVWYTTHFSTHLVTIQVTTPTPSPTPLYLILAAVLAAAAILLLIFLILLLIRRRKTTHLVVSSGTSQVAGTVFYMTVTAKDARGNTVTGYTGTVHFSSSDSGSGVSLPSNYTFQPSDKGIMCFSVTLVTPTGTGSITATDTVTSSITGSQTDITVNAASATRLVFVGVPSSLDAGVTSGAITVQLQDAHGNPVNAESAVMVALSPSGKWYSDSDGSTLISNDQITISAGSSSSSSFYFKSTAAGSRSP